MRSATDRSRYCVSQSTSIVAGGALGRQQGGGFDITGKLRIVGARRQCAGAGIRLTAAGCGKGLAVDRNISGAENGWGDRAQPRPRQSPATADWPAAPAGSPGTAAAGAAGTLTADCAGAAVCARAPPPSRSGESKC
jgi:hypothetical protein